MNAAKRLPIVVILLGLAVFISAALNLSNLSNSSRRSLEKQVDEILAHEKGADLVEPGSKIDELNSVQEDTAFSKLPQAKQQAIQERLRDLKAFQDFQKRLQAISNPREARSFNQLRQILSQLDDLKIPEEYQTDWSRTEAGQRYKDWLEDAKTLDKVASETRDELQTLAREGNEVLINKNAPDLPGRVKKVLDKAKQLRLPESNQIRLIPGSDGRLTYAMVLQLAEVQTAYQEWKKVRITLESVSKKERR